MRKLALTLAAAAALSITASAQAAITTTDFSFTSGAGDGTFSLDFDSNTSAYSLSALNFKLTGGALTFTPLNSGIETSGSDLVLGGNVSGVSVISSLGGDDFAFLFDPTANSQTKTLLYFIAGISQIPQATPVTITQGTAGGVPEPASWAMMLLGFAGIGLATRRELQGRRQAVGLAVVTPAEAGVSLPS